jgi:hypothetical protein
LQDHRPEVYFPLLYMKHMLSVLPEFYGCFPCEEVLFLLRGTVFQIVDEAFSGNRHIVSSQDMFKVLLRIQGRAGRDNLSGNFILDFSSSLSTLLHEELSCVNLDLIISCYRKQWGNDVPCNPVNVKKMILMGTQSEGELEKFAGFIYRNESVYNFRMYDVMAEYLSAYETV